MLVRLEKVLPAGQILVGRAESVEGGVRVTLHFYSEAGGLPLATLEDVTIRAASVAREILDILMAHYAP